MDNDTTLIRTHDSLDLYSMLSEGLDVLVSLNLPLLDTLVSVSQLPEGSSGVIFSERSVMKSEVEIDDSATSDNLDGWKAEPCSSDG